LRSLVWQVLLLFIYYATEAALFLGPPSACVATPLPPQHTSVRTATGRHTDSSAIPTIRYIRVRARVRV